MKHTLPLTALALVTLASAVPSSAQTLSGYNAYSLEVTVTGGKSGLAGTKNCTALLASLLKKGDVAVQGVTGYGDDRKSLGIVLGNYQKKIIVTGTCLSGGTHGVISIVNPYANSTPTALVDRLRSLIR